MPNKGSQADKRKTCQEGIWWKGWSGWWARIFRVNVSYIENQSSSHLQSLTINDCSVVNLSELWMSSHRQKQIRYWWILTTSFSHWATCINSLDWSTNPTGIDVLTCPIPFRRQKESRSHISHKQRTLFHHWMQHLRQRKTFTPSHTRTEQGLYNTKIW